MAMKIGDEYKPEKVASRDFEKLAEQAGLAKPLVRRRVLELAQAVLDSTGKVKIDHEVARKVAALIRKRCETARPTEDEQTCRTDSRSERNCLLNCIDRL
jgi:hypothetical protein